MPRRDAGLAQRFGQGVGPRAKFAQAEPAALDTTTSVVSAKAVRREACTGCGLAFRDAH